MDQLPYELQLKLVKTCAPKEWLTLLRTNRQLYTMVRICQRQRRDVDVLGDYLTSDAHHKMRGMLHIDIRRLIEYLTEYHPSLSCLSLKGCPTHVSAANLHMLAEHLPQLTTLNLCRLFEEPKFTRDVLSALTSFRQLSHLSVDSVASPHVAGQVLYFYPLLTLQSLVRLSFNCKSGTLFRLLRVMRGQNRRFPSLAHLSVGNRPWVVVNAPDLDQLHWLLDVHRETLQTVTLKDFTFDWNAKLLDLLDWLLEGMRRLRRLVFQECEFRGKINVQWTNKFQQKYRRSSVQIVFVQCDNPFLSTNED